MGAWLASALTTGTELAHRRFQRPSTAHLLVALYRSEPSVLSVCAQFSLREVALMAELIFVEERPNNIETVIERAKKLAIAMGMHRLFPLHLLHALAHEPQSASNRMLSRLDVSPERLGQAALDALESPTLQPFLVAAARELVAAEQAERARPAQSMPSRLETLTREYQREQARANGLWLGDEVEKRLHGRGRRSPDRAPTTFADQVEARLRGKR